MADGALLPRPALRPAPATPADPGVVLTVLPDGPQAILLARRGQAGALAERCRGFGLALPLTPQRVESRGLGLVWMGPAQWLMDWSETEQGRARQLFDAFGALCTVVRADDARVRIAVAGPRARDTLAKLLAIDLHPRAFRPGDAAITIAAGVSVLIWQVDASPAYRLAVPRSYAQDAWDLLAGSAAEYGAAIEVPPQL